MQHGCIDVAVVLIEVGAELEARDTAATTPLHLAGEVVLVYRHETPDCRIGLAHLCRRDSRLWRDTSVGSGR